MIDLGLNKNATRMLTGLIMGTIVLSCIIAGNIALLLLLILCLLLVPENMLKF